MRKQFIGSIVCSLFVVNICSACPDLTGTWNCHDTDNGPYTISITQEPHSPSGTIYHFAKPVSGTVDIIADGRTYPYVDGEAVGTQTATCTHPTTLTIHATAKEVLGNFEYVMITTVNKTNSNHFDLSIEAIVKTPDQPDQIVDQQTPCEL